MSYTPGDMRRRGLLAVKIGEAIGELGASCKNKEIKEWLEEWYGEEVSVSEIKSIREEKKPENQPENKAW